MPFLKKVFFKKNYFSGDLGVSHLSLSHLLPFAISSSQSCPFLLLCHLQEGSEWPLVLLVLCPISPAQPCPGSPRGSGEPHPPLLSALGAAITALTQTQSKAMGALRRTELVLELGQFTPARDIGNFFSCDSETQFKQHSNLC